MDELVKNKKRAMRRKRNFIAKELKTNPLWHARRVEGKGRVKKKMSVKEVEQFLMEEIDQ